MRRRNRAQKAMILITSISVSMTVVFTILYIIKKTDVWFALSMTFGTIAYQFLIRLAIGWSISIGVKKTLNYNNKWFRQKKIEIKLFEVLRVKKWKRKIPTFIPENFNMNKNPIQVVIQNMCIAELGHEIMMLASFFSLFFSLLTNDWRTYIWIFIITSCFAAVGDLLFVVVQRYNRPRLVVLLKTKNAALCK